MSNSSDSRGGASGWLALARIFIGGELALALAVGAMQRFNLGPMWLVELTRFAPVVLALVPATLGLALGAWLGRRWLALAAVAWVVLVVGLMDLELHRGDAGTDRLRVMTYNIKSYLAGDNAGGYAPIAWEVALHDPDILVMQDAGMLTDERERKPDTAQSIFAGRHVYARGQYIVVSRYPLRDCQRGDISYRKSEHSYVRCTVEVRGREIDVLTAHFLSPRDGLNATRYEAWRGVAEWRDNLEDRLTQASKLAADVVAAKRPVIVAGDLNAPQTSPVIDVLQRAGVRDAFATAGVGYGYTHGHSLKPRVSFLRIDHILVGPQLGVADCFVGGKQGSEHRPVIADLWLTRQ